MTPEYAISGAKILQIWWKDLSGVLHERESGKTRSSRSGFDWQWLSRVRITIRAACTSKPRRCDRLHSCGRESVIHGQCCSSLTLKFSRAIVLCLAARAIPDKILKIHSPGARMQAILALEDGRVFRASYGAKGECYGEVFLILPSPVTRKFHRSILLGQIVVTTSSRNYGTIKR